MAGSEGAQEVSNSMLMGRKGSMAMTEDGESGDNCRICRGESTPEQPLFHPCKCSGSIKYVHQECLMEWLSHSQKKYCELCKTSFRFTKLYDQSMPEKLPLPLFLQQLILHGGRRLARGLRYVLVVFVWFCWLPWSIRQVWLGLFWLADGSWMTAQDLHYMATAASAQRNLSTVDATINSTILPAPEMINILADSATSWGFFATVFNLASTDALLKGLLRLVAHKSSTAGSLSPGFNTTSTVPNPSIPGRKRTSVLADIQSLNSFTKYPVLNNGLIDLLEGQLICLAVITAFILVFLIREWVVNQQPVHQMPDPDQAEAQLVQAIQEENGRQAGARMGRVAVRQVQNDNLQAAGRPMDLANRPRAIPRPRRAVTDDNIGVPQADMLGPMPPHLPARADSMQALDTSGLLDNVDLPDIAGISALARNSALTQNIRSPPLQRGILDEVVDIRRHIEEHTISDIGDQNYQSRQDQASIDSHSSNSITLQNNGAEGASSLIMDRPTTSPSPSNSTSSVFTEDSFNTEDHPAEFSNRYGPSPRVSVESLEGSDLVVQNRQSDRDGVPWEMLHDVSVASMNDGATVETDLDQAAQAVTTSPVPDVIIDEPPAAPRSLAEKLAIWLWDTEQYRPQQGLAPTPPVAEILGNHAQAPFVPINPLAAIQQPAAPQPPLPVPELQWGIDINEPNAMDDLEDVEGILELVGMEGPIAGMFQNFIFSVFLISLTLAATIWCPYIWGKISLLIMSSPIGVFVKAPLFFISNIADIIIDLILLMAGLLGYGLTSVTKTLRGSLLWYLPASSRYLQFEAAEDFVLNITQRSSSRLEKALSVTVFHLQPDLPTFSMQSHHALRIFKAAFFEAVSAVSTDILDTITMGEELWHAKGLLAIPILVFKELTTMPSAAISVTSKCTAWFKVLSENLKMPPLTDPDKVDYSLIEWTTKDRVLAVFAGYILFVLVACAYLQIAHWVYGLKSDEKVNGIFADSLRQAGGVAKVIVIIGIEMIIFPLYCGCLLDLALLPLFRGATVSSRVSFFLNAPITGLFVHWFLGTCYMFHFALFVSMCRKILRKGVLYFIRDPDDPTFHPVRDVLERPVASQLSKITFSAGVYGGLVIVCLGSVIWALSKIGGIFPIEWTASEPRLAFPVDIISFNFILPFVAKRAEPSKKISALYAWWFRWSAKTLKLGHFLFGKKWEEHMAREALKATGATSDDQAHVDELPPTNKGQGSSAVVPNPDSGISPSDGRWVRAPAADSVRIPKGTKVFLEVDENNNRIDGLTDRENGLHGKNDERFIKIFIPSNFKIRICMFVFLVWLFAAFTGATVAIVPLMVGRQLICLLTGIQKAPNDLYAVTVGMHASAAVAYTILIANKQQALLRARGLSMLSNVKEDIVRFYHAIKYASGLLYIAIAFGVVIPAFLSLLAELYIHMPVYSYVASSTSALPLEAKPALQEVSTIGPIPTVYLIQAWTLGILYLRILLRVATSYPTHDSRAAIAIKAIIRDGILHPDVRLATRAFILPTVAMTISLLVLPLFLARTFILITNTSDKAATVYRNAYPALLIVAITMYVLLRVHGKVEGWQAKVRDEVYLVGERLHNFSDPPSDPKSLKISVPKLEPQAASGATDSSSEQTITAPPPQPSTSVPSQTFQFENRTQERDSTSLSHKSSDLDFRGLNQIPGEGSSSTAQLE